MKLSAGTPIPLAEARVIANHLVELLRPHCERIEIAGSIRREKDMVKDIELVIIPKPYEVGLFTSGIASVIGEWESVKGKLGPECKYTQRIYKGIYVVDIFFAVPENWGLIFAIRTGSADYSHHVLAAGWVKRGYKSVGGHLRHNDNLKETIPLREEQDLFNLLCISVPAPKERIFAQGHTSQTVGRGVQSNFERTHSQYNGGIE